MGGYVALYITRHYSGIIYKIIALATKFYWDLIMAAKEISMLDAKTISEKLPAFAYQLQELHSYNDWKKMPDKTKLMLWQMTQYTILKPDDHPSLPVYIYHSAGLVFYDCKNGCMDKLCHFCNATSFLIPGARGTAYRSKDWVEKTIELRLLSYVHNLPGGPQIPPAGRS